MGLAQLTMELLYEYGFRLCRLEALEARCLVDGES